MEEAKVYVNKSNTIVGFSKTTEASANNTSVTLEVYSGKTSGSEVPVSPVVLEEDVIGKDLAMVVDDIKGM